MSKIMFDFWRKKILAERRLTQFEISVMKFWNFWWTSFFWQNEITLWGKKHTNLFQTHSWEKSIFRSARTSCTTSGCMYTCPQEKSGSQYIQAYMPHESSEDSSNLPDGPMGSPRCPPWPTGTPWPPHEPPRTPKQVSWPHTDSRSPRLHYKSSEDPSNVTADPVEHLTLPPWPPGTL